MRTGPGKLVLLLLGGGLLSAPTLLANKKQEAAKPVPIEQRRAVHALNRLTFGPRPGDVQRVMSVGVEKWIDLQLHPDKIADRPIDSRLASFRTLHMSSKELAENFPDHQVVREVLDGKRSMPSDAARRAVYRVQIARLQDQKERKSEIAGSQAVPLSNPGNNAGAEQSSSTSANAVTSGNASRTMENEVAPTAAPGADSTTPSSELKPPTANDPAARRREERLYADIAIQPVFDLPPHERYQKVLGLPVEEQLALADSLRGNQAQEFIAGMEPQQQETILALLRNPQAVVADELAQAKILRAIYSERQLEQVMTDFWFNHFNVYLNKGADRLLVTSYEQETIRPRALGNFEDLLVATAKSPAMLFYLDNWLSVGPESAKALGLVNRPVGHGPYGRPRRMPPNQPKAKRQQNSGLNENYGRELLELHTLSVNGGYSQRDVTEAAKVFSGWTIDKPFAGGGFRFDPLMHEPGPKFVLGHRIKPKGEDEGREVLHRLATSPQTAHFIALKLAERFISDDPPPALVDRMAKTFLKKKGDIRAVLSELFHSPEFWAEDTYRAKLKTPLEFVTSAVRSTGAEVDDAAPLLRQLSDMGMPLYAAQPPTGYSMKAETWVGSSALLNRMNFAVALAAGKVRGVAVDAAKIAGTSSIPADPTMTLSAMEVGLLGGDVSRQTHESIVAQIEESEQNTPGAGKKKSHPGKAETPPDASVMAGLLLGSPEFQKR